MWLPAWEEGIFPSQRTLDEHGLKGLEEERRLAYVGITRARSRLFISHAGNRRVHGRVADMIPSRFMGELPDEHSRFEAGFSKDYSIDTLSNGLSGLDNFARNDSYNTQVGDAPRPIHPINPHRRLRMM